MAVVVNATPNDPNANSYLTLAEYQAYLETAYEPAEASGALEDGPNLVQATRLMEAQFSPSRRLVRPSNGSPYYLVRPTWTGSPATATQRLMWGRTGMYARTGVLLTDVEIVSNSVANPTVVTTATAHRLKTGGAILISGVVGSTPDINGPQIVTVIDATTFSVPVNVTVPGAGGSLASLPQELKDATAELARQLKIGDRTADNDVAVKGITAVRAGAVSLSFKGDGIDVTKVIPDIVFLMIPPSWLTDELYEDANQAMFDVVSER